MIRLSRVVALVAMVAATAFAAEPAVIPTTHTTGDTTFLGSLLNVGLSIVQFVVALGIAAFAITKGLQVVSRLLGGLDIWAEIKKKNLAVALLAAGAVISYARVVGSGIDGMSRSLASIAGGNVVDGASALVAGLISLVVAILVASFAITVTFKIMDKLTTDIDEKAELSSGNIAIGILYCGILIGVSGLVASGVGSIATTLQKLISHLF